MHNSLPQAINYLLFHTFVSTATPTFAPRGGLFGTDPRQQDYLTSLERGQVDLHGTGRFCQPD